MSLRSFHIIFILIVTLFFTAVATWALALNDSGDASLKGVGIAAAVVAVLAPIYGAYFYRKVKHIL